MTTVQRILVTNDDGIDAPGMAILEKIAHTLSDDVWVVAPKMEQSGMGHALTLTEPLRIEEYGNNRFSIKGTPTDCVMMALHQIMVDCKPTLILSGINRGGNLAEDVTYSGTVSAAMEGTICGIPSIALSQKMNMESRNNPFPVAEKYATQVIESLLEQSWPQGVLLNVNFPPKLDDIKGVRVCRQGFRDESEMFIEKRTDPRRNEYYWIGFRNIHHAGAIDTDLAAMEEGYISVTPLHLDMTHEKTLLSLSNHLNKDFS